MDLGVGGKDAFGEALDHGAGEGEVLGFGTRQLQDRKRGWKGWSTSMLMPSRSLGVPAPAVPSSFVADVVEMLDFRGGIVVVGDGSVSGLVWEFGE